MWSTANVYLAPSPVCTGPDDVCWSFMDSPRTRVSKNYVIFLVQGVLKTVKAISVHAGKYNRIGLHAAQHVWELF